MRAAVVVPARELQHAAKVERVLHLAEDLDRVGVVVPARRADEGVARQRDQRAVRERRQAAEVTAVDVLDDRAEGHLGFLADVDLTVP